MNCVKNESGFCLLHHDGRIPVWRHRGERLLNCCVMYRHTGPVPGVMVWNGAYQTVDKNLPPSLIHPFCVSHYNDESLFLHRVGNMCHSPDYTIGGNETNNERKKTPEVVPFHQGIPGTIFQQDNARPHVAKTVGDFCSAQHVQLLSWPAYSPDISPIEHVWDYDGRCLARDPRPAASKHELLLRMQAKWSSLLQADIQNVFDSMPRRIAALIAARGGCTKY
ncbi:transposable element Tc1 transposase [Trichonephila clavipes]|uniref:Transposable element Tc1 transposase n=1 Tax=Trichonephila clavipes TaxID=2585209 RepID=A0A8X6T4U1_TRICX|nr:transposable element Tc1 transposase [Trichonephila clavipes]